MSDISAQLDAFVGQTLVPTTWGPDEVNIPMIRHWAETMGDTNPVYLDDEAARATGRDGVVAPAQMLQVWIMRTFTDKMAGNDPSQVWTDLIATLDAAGYSSVVATDSDQEFFAELRPGDRVNYTEVIESISPEKKTGLGVGHFVTTLKTYRNGDDQVVGTQRWRTLRFKPQESAAPEAPRALRPRPALNADNAFWFEAAKEHRLVIQRCTSCKTLRHPTGPMCGECQSLEWDTIDASGRGTVYSFVVNHHPKIDAFDYPLIVAVIELDEGTRLIANMMGIAPEDVVVDMPVELDWIDADPDLTLPAFRPAVREEH
ncbi:MaoC family dehydratase N-terminal domain-containing protein [Rhodococcus erythropolis]|uniref:bifunctional MaoC family dehydratase N-terminal/OB-fold nucleic acid binding domain-containing protein n=1 Tax=Rhodococcus erythropolis TaxID=1833 RepID=UPI001E51616F|nr:MULTISPECIES: MaoC family dehydratase N-terminal domain-containing protein [Rhodococcus erythropolis group]MCD2106536.1 MaoC family dehydratase N-terminal domain-containing protein [Rhodococcus qingshengii]MCZ4525585.1 MaoC family dehydratase N-terminal domain-containing protein [Rhodococcus erythropolis]